MHLFQQAVVARFVFLQPFGKSFELAPHASPPGDWIVACVAHPLNAPHRLNKWHMLLLKFLGFGRQPRSMAQHVIKPAALFFLGEATF